MNTCDFNTDLKRKLEVSISKVGEALASGRRTSEQAGAMTINILKQYSDYNSKEVANTVIDAARNSGLSVDEQAFPWISANQIVKFIENGYGSTNSPVEDLTAARLEKNDPARYRKQLNKDFLEKAFGLAVNARNRAKMQINDDLFNHTIINLKPGEANGVIMTTDALNENLRIMQREHLDNVINYLKQEAEKSTEKQSRIKFLEKNSKMYDDKNNYTGAVDNIYKIAEGFLTPTTFSAQVLNELTKSPKLKEAEPKALYNLLQHAYWYRLAGRTSRDPYSKILSPQFHRARR